MAQTQIELTEAQVAALENLAKQRNMTFSELIHEGINNLIQSKEHPYTPEQKQRALAIVGRFRSQCGDLSQRHDQYFLETLDS